MLINGILVNIWITKLNKIILKDNSKVEKVEFFDFSGKVIKPNKVVKTQNRLDINVSNIIEGIYLLHIITDKEVNKVKVVIERWE